MTKLQRKRRAARYRRLFRRHDQALLNFHVALDPKHEWQVSRSVYHHKQRAWSYGMGRKGLPMGGRYVLDGLLDGLRLNQHEQAALVELTSKPWSGVTFSHTEIHHNG